MSQTPPLPEEIVQEIERIYREEAALHIPEVQAFWNALPNSYRQEFLQRNGSNSNFNDGK